MHWWVLSQCILVNNRKCMPYHSAYIIHTYTHTQILPRRWLPLPRVTFSISFTLPLPLSLSLSHFSPLSDLLPLLLFPFSHHFLPIFFHPPRIFPSSPFTQHLLSLQPPANFFFLDLSQSLHSFHTCSHDSRFFPPILPIHSTYTTFPLLPSTTPVISFPTFDHLLFL